MENSDAQIDKFVAEHAPELDAKAVKEFMAEHDKPADVPESHLAWAVGVLRQRGENEAGDGLSVDTVVNEIRRQDR